MQLLLTKNFAKWANKKAIANTRLCDAAHEIQQGLVDASLGAGLYKKRLGKLNAGKRNGYRILLAFKTSQRIIYMFGFSKGEV